MAEKLKKVSLTISERIRALAILNSFKGDLDKLSLILEDIKEFPITEEDWAKAEKKVTDTGDGNSQWTWDDEKGGEKEITVHPEVIDYIVAEIKKKNDAGEFTLQDKAFITLKTKLYSSGLQ
mgnify:CR=1 FL=1